MVWRSSSSDARSGSGRPQALRFGGLLDQVQEHRVEVRDSGRGQRPSLAPGAPRMSDNRPRTGSAGSCRLPSIGRTDAGRPSIVGAGEQGVERGQRSSDALPNVEAPGRGTRGGPALWLLVAECRPCVGPAVTGTIGAAVAPLADLGDELQVAHELVVDEVVVPRSRHRRSDHSRSTLRRTPRPIRVRGPLEVRLEVLELGERLPARVHLDVEVLGRPMSSMGRRWNEIAGPIGRPAGPASGVGIDSANRSSIASIITSIDWMVGSCRQRKRYHGWSVIHAVGGDSSGSGVLDEPLAEHPRALPGRVGEVRPTVILGELAGSGGDVPVQEKQRGEALLPVEWLEACRPRPRRRRSRARPDRLVGQRLVEDIEEVAADPPDRGRSRPWA